MLRVISALMVPLLVYAVVVQFNDPDPARWIAMYGVAVVVSALAAVKKLPWFVPAPLAVVAVLWSLTLVGPSQAHGFSIAAEEPRELFGLLIVAGWMAALAIALRRSGTQGT